jgi:cytoskeletal protein CcmA (bactofilin family)
MALWNEKTTPAAPAGPVAAPPPSAPPERAQPASPADTATAISSRRPTPRASGEGGESVIAANLNIEGKIEGAGNVRIGGRFKGDVRIEGNFTIDSGAHLTGQVAAAVVVVGGELLGNIESAKRVDVQEGGVIVGDVKAGSITVAAGSRMRGHVEFGWEDEKVKVKPAVGGGN